MIRRKGRRRSLGEVDFATLQWIHWFNNHRMLEPIGDISPMEHESLYWLARAANDTVELQSTRATQCQRERRSGETHECTDSLCAVRGTGYTACAGRRGGASESCADI